MTVMTDRPSATVGRGVSRPGTRTSSGRCSADAARRGAVGQLRISDNQQYRVDAGG